MSVRDDQPAEVPPARVARLPRQRDDAPRPGKPTAPAAPPREERGMSRAMKVVFFGALALGALSVVLGRCATDRGAAGKARVHWNAPPTSTRQAHLKDLLAQAQTRAETVLPGAKLALLHARLVDARGMVDLDYGSADFEFIAPGQTPCSVHLVMSWSGWAQRPGGTCHEPPPAPRCSFDEIVTKAFAGKPEGATAFLDWGPSKHGPEWSVRFKDLPDKPVFEVEDACAP
jgi:hypothetical protein